MCDRVLATLAKLCSWQAARDDDYVSPIVRGMRRTVAAERARARVLDDDEIRLLWAHADGKFGAFLKVCLLSAQRRSKVMSLRREDLDINGNWVIPAEVREKASAGALKLGPLTLAIISEQPVVLGNPHVFAGEREKPFWPGDKLKRALDVKLTDANGSVPLRHWTIHDLRRTAKTLMRRAGVSAEISERVLGHAITGVEGVYDRHNYAAEKSSALVQLEVLLAEIIQAGR
jgi:integrase